MQGKYPVITLCGSIRFKEQFMEAMLDPTPRVRLSTLLLMKKRSDTWKNLK